MIIWPSSKNKYQDGVMTIDTIDTDSRDTLGLADWLKNDKVGELQRHLEERIMRLFFSNDPNDIQFLQMVEQLAWIGADPRDKPLLAREIIALNSSRDNIVQQCFFKEAWNGACKAARFVADHKIEILVGAALCATGVGIAAATGYTVTVAAGGVALAGAGAIFTSNDKPNPHIPQIPPPSSKEEISLSQQSIFSPIPKLELPDNTNKLLVTTEGIWANGRFYSTKDLMQHSIFAEEFAKHTLIERNSHIVTVNQPEPECPKMPSEPIASIPDIPECNINSSCLPNNITAERESHPINSIHSSFADRPDQVISRKFTIPGESKSHLHIGWINGINNSFEESKMSATYLQSLAEGQTVAGIYNCSHTPLIDLIEAGLFNHHGFSPITAKMLQSEWQSFHEANVDKPNARLLQVCHSQGAIHVRNALEGSPSHIQNRVIVVAIAPGAVVPDRICFKSFNYASEKDFIYKLEPATREIKSVTVDDVIIPTFGDLIDDSDELIILKPHAEAKGIDHEFISPTYVPNLIRVLENYLRHGGEYLSEEKEGFL